MKSKDPVYDASNDLGVIWEPLARRSATDTAWTILTSSTTVQENNGRVIVTDLVALGSQPRGFLRLRAESFP